MLDLDRPRLWTPRSWGRLTGPQRAHVLQVDWNALSTGEQMVLAGIRGGAGLYTDLPDIRLEYDRDGTVVNKIRVTEGTITELTGPQMQELNDESLANPLSVPATTPNGARLAFIFPELRDIAAYFVADVFSNLGPASLEKSADTTNGMDGTWSTVQATFVDVQSLVKPEYRTSIQTVTANAIKGLRFNTTNGSADYRPAVLHLYGGISATEDEYLVVWLPNTAASTEPTGDAAAGPAHFDWGDVPRSSSQDRKFRIKNAHPTETASSIVVSAEALTDTTPSVPGQYLFSDDGSVFVAQLNIGNLAAGALSGDLWCRRTTPADATQGLWSARIIAEADGGWA